MIGMDVNNQKGLWFLFRGVKPVKNTPEIPWERIYRFTLSCGQIHEPKAFTVQVLKGLPDFCGFDRATVYYYDATGRICDQYLTDNDTHWSALYLEYYASYQHGQYSHWQRLLEDPGKPVVNLRDWMNEPPNEFITQFIRPRNLRYSLGFCLFDLNGMIRSLFCLDRKTDENFSNEEVTALSLAVPLLNNLFKNLHFNPVNRGSSEQICWETACLTPRENEVANLLCQGLTPANISQLLHISLPTANKHIAHIYKKMQVSSRQQLLVRLLH